MAIGIRGHSHVAALIIGVTGAIAKGICDLGRLILDIALTGYRIAHPVALAGIEPVSVHHIRLL